MGRKTGLALGQLYFKKVGSKRPIASNTRINVQNYRPPEMEEREVVGELEVS